MAELTFLKVLVLTIQVHQKSGEISNYWHFLQKAFKNKVLTLFWSRCFWDECYDVSVMSMTSNDVAILKSRDVHYHFIIDIISKSKAVSWLPNAHLSKKALINTKCNFPLSCVKDR